MRIRLDLSGMSSSLADEGRRERGEVRSPTEGKESGQNLSYAGANRRELTPKADTAQALETSQRPSLRPPGHSASPSTPCGTDQNFSPREVRSADVEAGSLATEKDGPGTVLVVGLWQDGRVCRVVWVGRHSGKCRGSCTIWRLGKRELRLDSLDLQQRPPSLSRICQIPATVGTAAWPLRTSSTGSDRRRSTTSTRTRRSAPSAARSTSTPRSRSRRTSTVRRPGPLPRYRRILIKSLSSLLCFLAFDDGRTLLLLCLHGTLPITYSSARYNVPVAVWVPLDFARSPPMVYVVPTSGMLVRKGKGVELDGRVSETEWEYLKGWRRKWEVRRPTLTVCPNRAFDADQDSLACSTGPLDAAVTPVARRRLLPLSSGVRQTRAGSAHQLPISDSCPRAAIAFNIQQPAPVAHAPQLRPSGTRGAS